MSDSQKRLAGEAAVLRVEGGMTVGLGTGSTAAWFVKALAARKLPDLRCVPTSDATADLARELGLPLSTLEDTPRRGVLGHASLLTVTGCGNGDGRLVGVVCDQVVHAEGGGQGPIFPWATSATSASVDAASRLEPSSRRTSSPGVNRLSPARSSLPRHSENAFGRG